MSLDPFASPAPSGDSDPQILTRDDGTTIAYHCINGKSPGVIFLTGFKSDMAGGKAPDDIDGKSFAPVLRGKTKTHRDKIFTTNTGDKEMNIYPIRSVRIGKYKYIHNLRPDAYHTNHSDRLRSDGRGAYWDSWDEAAKTDPKAAAIIKSYHVRPEFEFFDLDKDPLELENLADHPEYKGKLARWRAELKAWTTVQGDELQPHRDPYLTSAPIPEVKRKPKKKKAKQKSE